MKRAQAPVALTAPVAEVRNNNDSFLKPQNLDLYYSYLHIEYYYFWQKCKNYFKVVGSLGHKCVSFTIDFLKNRILNYWQQHKTRI